MNNLTANVKPFEIRGKNLYLDGELLPFVQEFSLTYSKKVRGEPFAEAQYPFLEVKGMVPDDNGGILVKYGEIIEYHVAERVTFLGGKQLE